MYFLLTFLLSLCFFRYCSTFFINITGTRLATCEMAHTSVTGSTFFSSIIGHILGCRIVRNQAALSVIEGMQGRMLLSTDVACVCVCGHV